MPSARAIRWTSIANALAAQGHDVVVVCQGPAGSSIPTPGSPTVHRVEGGWLPRFRNRVASKVTGSATATVKRNWFRAFYDRTWRRLQWPDYAFAWRRPATRLAVDLLQGARFDAFITVAPPFTSQLVGLDLHRRFPEVRWLADFGDPFSFDDHAPPNNRRLYARRNHAVEEQVLRSADALVTVNEPLRRVWIRHFPTSAEKFQVIPPLLTSREPDAAPVLPRSPAKKMVFTGVLYKTAGPAPLFSLVDRVAKETGEEWELHLLGEPWEVRHEIEAHNRLVGKRVHLHGKVPLESAERAILEADVLVSIGMRSEIATPSKIFHYFGTGKPVIHVPYTWPDATAPYWERYPRSFVLPAEEALEHGPLPPELLELLRTADHAGTVPSWLDEHSPRQIAARYLDILMQDPALRGRDPASSEDAEPRPERPRGAVVPPRPTVPVAGSERRVRT